VSALTAASILAEASARAGGLESLGDDDGSFTEGLSRFVASLHADARLNAMGEVIARERALLHTVNRLHYVEDRARIPGITEQQIERPVFIIGMPRTGTSILHDIFAQDPANRAPLTWEVTFPSPPPRADTFATDPRIAQCAALMPAIEDQQLRAIHPMGAEMSQECVVLMGEAMCTPLFHNQFFVRGYQDWVDHGADWSRVYAFHVRQLQHLQVFNRRDRWVLKTGAHLWGLEHLLATYPDARIVFTHRDPVDSMTSYASLTTIVRRASSDHVDPAEVAADWIPRLRDVLLHGIAVRAAAHHPDAIFFDVDFREFVRDQFGVVENIYAAFDLPMSDVAAERMQKFIAANPPGVHGVHSYTPDQYGIDPDAVRSEFREYIDHFDISREDHDPPDGSS
jgi:hypothetical protein